MRWMCGSERAMAGEIAGTYLGVFGFVEIDEGLGLGALISHNQGA